MRVGALRRRWQACAGVRRTEAKGKDMIRVQVTKRLSSCRQALAILLCVVWIAGAIAPGVKAQSQQQPQQQPAQPAQPSQQQPSAQPAQPTPTPPQPNQQQPA